MLLCTAKLKELKCHEVAVIFTGVIAALGALGGIFFGLSTNFNVTIASAVTGSILVVAVVLIVSILIHFKCCEEKEEESLNLSKCSSKGRGFKPRRKNHLYL